MFWNNLKSKIEYHLIRRRLSQEEQIEFDKFNFLDKSITFDHLKNDRKLFIDFFYSEPEETLRELHRRNKNNFLKKKIKGIIHRDVTPNIEMNRMIGICDALDIEPVIFDNPRDKFSCLSRSKYRLAKLGFISGYNKNQQLIYNYEKIIDFSNIEGQSMNKIITFKGDTLIDYHKKWFISIYPNLENNIFDISKLIFKNKARNVYKKIFKLVTKDKILIESFVLTGSESFFIENIVFDTYVLVWQQTGLKPFVIPCDLLDLEENEEYWLSYVKNKKVI